MPWTDWLTDAAGLTPHGFCLTWQPALLWLNAGSDAATMLAYFSIPLALLSFLRCRRDLPERWIFLLFGAFIIACGATHAMSVLTLWVPAYHAEAAIKLITACLSAATAAALWPLLPKLLALPSAQRMAVLNEELRTIIAKQDQTTRLLSDSEERLLLAQETLQRGHDQLERRVAERTADLTRLNDAIGRSEARFRSVVEAAPNAMVTVSEQGRIEMVNAQTERMFGYAREEIIGQPIERLLPARFRAQHEAMRAPVFSEMQTRRMGGDRVVFALRRNGDQFEVEIGLNPIETDDGVKVLASVVDISNRVRLEAKLRQSHKMEAIGRLTAGIAHDFNNLLQALGGSLELLTDDLADRPQAVARLDVALRAAQRGGELVSQLLAFSRQQVLVTGAVPIAKLFAEVRSLLRHLFDDRIEVEVDDGPPRIAALADFAQLEAAIINLAVNARDAMPSGGKLVVAARSADPDAAMALPPGRYTVISVADTGSGMDAETLGKACDPFFTTKGLKGSGLGLSMVQGFVRQSGGDVRMSSVLGEGTRIEIWLPAAGPATASASPDAERRTMRGRILLVDDSPDVLLTVGAFLRQAGLDVTRVESGELALATLLAGDRFDVVITDFAMSGLNGSDLLEQAREIDPRMAAILITGFSNIGVVAAMDRMVVLRKPFRRAELMSQVDALLAAKPRGHATVA